VHECYVRVDYDGDGKAELRRIMVGGTSYEILKFASGGNDNDEIEEQPFSCWTPVPIPHRHYGRSVAELVDDLQRIKTVLMRQMLDNVYLTNNPTKEIAQEGIIQGVTLADMLHERPGKIVRTAQPGHYFEHSPPQFMQQMLPAIQYIDDVRENRTGVTKFNQGLDSDSLNKTAHGIERVMSASMKKIALYARICAETGLRHLFQGIHGDLRRNSSKALTLRLRNEYVQVDPRSWAERADLSVNIGIGTTDKQMRMAFLEKIISEIKEHLVAGSPLAKPSHLFNAYERFISNAGFKNPEEFFTNPTGTEMDEMPKGQEQGDPQAQAYMQAEAMKTQQREADSQRKAEIEKGKLQISAMEAQIKASDQQSDAATDAAKIEIERLKLELEAAKAGLEQEKLAFERERTFADREASTKGDFLKAGMPPDYSYETDRQAMEDELEKAVTAMAQVMMEAMREMQASSAHQSEALTAAVQALTLPKEVVRDKDGRATGVRTKLN